jgi:hypothetical protein
MTDIVERLEATGGKGQGGPLKKEAADEIRKLRAIIASAQGAWPPIETAPQDGTEIIGVFYRKYDETTPPTIYGPWTIAYDGRKWRSSWDGSEVIEYMSDFGTEYKGPDIEPTHWKPLPDTSTLTSAERAPLEGKGQ